MDVGTAISGNLADALCERARRATTPGNVVVSSHERGDDAAEAAAELALTKGHVLEEDHEGNLVTAVDYFVR